jgi:hypothetical protein
MTSVWFKPTDCADSLMRVGSVALNDASYTEVSRHLRFLASRRFGRPSDIRSFSTGSICTFGLDVGNPG